MTDALLTDTLLQVRDLHCGYDKTEIVHGVSFDAFAGEFVCVIGANGCGKTTTLKSILGLLRPFGGSVMINGKETLHLSEKERARYFAYIPQAHTPPFPFIAADVVLMRRTPYISTLSHVTDEDKQIAFEAMELMGIDHLGRKTYSQLSGGQQQLVLIARALAQQPSVLVMDEPTASLDFGNQQTVLRQMKKLTQGGTTVLMVTHDPDHALYCADRVIAMHEGLILDDGAPSQVMTTDLLHTIYDTDARILEVETGPGKFIKVCVPVQEE